MKLSHDYDFLHVLYYLSSQNIYHILTILILLEQSITPLRRYAFLYSEKGRFVRLDSCWVTNVIDAATFYLLMGDSVCSKW